ncbi:hypothetical protein RSK20926_20032 [Roseobacter sp. SK209-2-6]|uniref:hypothetical protein n=1 Tax=Roseobacter sp. SK209-2-6 TaxID=388739 RepID=UPI0000F3F643|nr:hypothetical protein [Roseobacter sp. SK209-2-6]EBA18063.1 hypothetical protein RSK20926_20032 [Roseobacter sp. SK209-2-6]
MAQDIFAEIEEVQALLKSHAEASGSLTEALKKARRRLPRRIYRQGMRLATALPLLEHPKLRFTLDQAGLVSAAKEVKAHLKEIDLADRRKGRILSVLGSMAFSILAVATLLIVVLRWRGFI